MKNAGTASSYVNGTMDELRLSDDVALAIYRITQEALNNTVKHARASQAEVRLECDSGLVKLTISDNGVGFDPEALLPHGYGLQGMRERAEQLGGSFNLQSEPKVGTTIIVETPI